MDDQRKAFVLRYVQPGLAGLMDGSVSTLAPHLRHRLCHAQYAHRLPHRAGRRRGRGISMAFSEALSDTGELTGRGNP